jgi:hypothetical protein
MSQKRFLTHIGIVRYRNKYARYGFYPYVIRALEVRSRAASNVVPRYRWGGLPLGQVESAALLFLGSPLYAATAPFNYNYINVKGYSLMK